VRPRAPTSSDAVVSKFIMRIRTLMGIVYGFRVHCINMIYRSWCVYTHTHTHKHTHTHRAITQSFVLIVDFSCSVQLMDNFCLLCVCVCVYIQDRERWADRDNSCEEN